MPNTCGTSGGDLDQNIRKFQNNNPIVHSAGMYWLWLVSSFDDSKIAFSFLLNSTTETKIGRDGASKTIMKKHRNLGKRSGSHTFDTQTHRSIPYRQKDNPSTCSQNSTLEWTWIGPHGSNVVIQRVSKIYSLWSSFSSSHILSPCLDDFLKKMSYLDSSDHTNDTNPLKTKILFLFP